MADKLGEEYDAHISGIASYGIYCEIDENHCEGMVPMRDLDDDYYDFDERNYCLVGRRRHQKSSNSLVSPCSNALAQFLGVILLLHMLIKHRQHNYYQPKNTIF